MTFVGGKRKSRRSKSASRRSRSKRSKSRGRRSALDLSRAITQQGMPEHLRSVEGAPNVAMDKLFKVYTPASPDARSLSQSGSHPLQSHTGTDLDPYLKELMNETNKLVEIASVGKQEAKEYSYPSPEQKGGALMGLSPLIDPYNVGMGMGMGSLPMGLSHHSTSILSPAKTMEEARRMRSYEINKKDMNDAIQAKKPEYYLLEDERGVDPYKRYLTVMYDTGSSVPPPSKAAATTTTQTETDEERRKKEEAERRAKEEADRKAAAAAAGKKGKPAGPPQASGLFTSEQVAAIDNQYAGVSQGTSASDAYNTLIKELEEQAKQSGATTYRGQTFNGVATTLKDISSKLSENEKKLFIIYANVEIDKVNEKIGLNKLPKVSDNIKEALINLNALQSL